MSDFCLNYTHTMETINTQFEPDENTNSGEVVNVEEEDILVYVNVNNRNDDLSLSDLDNLKAIGLDSDEPLIQIGDKFFGGKWNQTVGTAVFFGETAAQPKRCYFSDNVSKPLNYIAKTQKSLDLKRVFISRKKNVSETENKPDVITNGSETLVNEDIPIKQDNTVEIVDAMDTELKDDIPTDAPNITNEEITHILEELLTDSSSKEPLGDDIGDINVELPASIATDDGNENVTDL